MTMLLGSNGVLCAPDSTTVHMIMYAWRCVYTVPVVVVDNNGWLLNNNNNNIVICQVCMHTHTLVSGTVPIPNYSKHILT